MKRLITIVVLTIAVAACATDGKILDNTPKGGDVRSGPDSGSQLVGTPDAGKNQTLRHLGQ